MLRNYSRYVSTNVQVLEIRIEGTSTWANSHRMDNNPTSQHHPINNPRFIINQHKQAQDSSNALPIILIHPETVAYGDGTKPEAGIWNLA